MRDDILEELVVFMVDVRMLQKALGLRKLAWKVCDCLFGKKLEISEPHKKNMTTKTFEKLAYIVGESF